ncbi:MAG TPA: hypothetical protein VJV23_08265 [Candidatus Polarisedimenticolia bacterium]|nr:hypothetical protein [Candidatus Polarisedimenticolia bacterium]
MKRALRKVYEYWLAFGHAIGLVMTPIQLFLVYGLVFGLARLGVLAARKDLLDRRFAASLSFWKRRELPSPGLDEARHQF